MSLHNGTTPLYTYGTAASEADREFDLSANREGYSWNDGPKNFATLKQQVVEHRPGAVIMAAFAVGLTLGWLIKRK